MDQSDAQTWAVYAVLHKHGFGSQKGCYVSEQTMKDITGLGTASIRTRIQWLLDSGWVTAQKRPGFTTVYYVRIDEPRSNLTGVKNDTPFKNELGGSSKIDGGVVQKSTTNQNPRTRTQEPEPLLNREVVQKSTGLDDQEPAHKDPVRLKKLQPSAVPFDLADCSDLIVEFWASKKGTRSTSVFTRICNKLRQWSPEERKASLEAAIANGWGDVFPRRAQAASRGSTDPSALISRMSDSGWLDS